MHSLEVAEAQFDHSGKYRLEATNQWGNCFTESPVAVQGKVFCHISSHVIEHIALSYAFVINSVFSKLVPPVVKVPLADKEGHHHKQMILECTIHGSPNPDIKWFKNGKELKQTKVSLLVHILDFNFQLHNLTNAQITY